MLHLTVLERTALARLKHHLLLLRISGWLIPALDRGGTSTGPLPPARDTSASSMTSVIAKSRSIMLGMTRSACGGLREYSVASV